LRDPKKTGGKEKGGREGEWGMGCWGKELGLGKSARGGKRVGKGANRKKKVVNHERKNVRGASNNGGKRNEILIPWRYWDLERGIRTRERNREAVSKRNGGKVR